MNENMKVELGYEIMAGIVFPVMRIEQQSFHFGMSCDTPKRARWFCKQMESAIRKISDCDIEYVGLISKI